MDEKTHVVVYEAEPDGRYSVSVPDLPGCFSWGATRSEATERIAETIAGWIETAREAGMAIPDPGTALGSVRVAA